MLEIIHMLLIGSNNSNVSSARGTNAVRGGIRMNNNKSGICNITTSYITTIQILIQLVTK